MGCEYYEDDGIYQTYVLANRKSDIKLFRQAGLGHKIIIKSTKYMSLDVIKTINGLNREDVVLFEIKDGIVVRIEKVK